MRWQRHVALLCCRLAALHGFAVQQMAPTGRQPAINRVPTIGFWKVTKEIKDSWVSLGCLGNCEISCAKVAQRGTSRDGLQCSCPCSVSGMSCLCTATIGLSNRRSQNPISRVMGRCPAGSTSTAPPAGTVLHQNQIWGLCLGSPTAAPASVLFRAAIVLNMTFFAVVIPEYTESENRRIKGLQCHGNMEPRSRGVVGW